MLTLLSPAKTLDLSPPSIEIAPTDPVFEKDTAVLRNRCRKLGVRSLRKLMSLSEPLAELNYQRFQEMSPTHTPENSKAALLTFQGDVYRALDAGTLRAAELEYAQDHLRILSGLYGLLRPLDTIQPYRLEMGTRLANTRGKNLYDFWGTRIVDELNREHAARPVSAVLNLASNEYFKAVKAKLLNPPLVTAVFQEIRDGKPRTISFLAKKARGLMARYVIENRIEDPRGLEGFDSGGYGFAPDLSTGERLVFTREQ